MSMSMTACGSLHNIFEKPVPQNPPSILESLSSWKLIESVKHGIEDPCYTEIYSDIHFKDNQNELLCSSPLPLSSASSGEILPPCSIESFDKEKNDCMDKNGIEKSPTSYNCSGHRKQYKHSDSFSSQNSETLSLCTESLGFESSDDVEDLRNENCFFDFQIHEDRICRSSRHSNATKESRRSRTSKGPFPPPISCIGKTGKPWVYFETYRQDGRFILQEVRIPTQEFLHSCREDGRLRMQLIQSDDEIFEGDEDDDDDFGTVEE